MCVLERGMKNKSRTAVLHESPVGNKADGVDDVARGKKVAPSPLKMQNLRVITVPSLIFYVK